VIEYKVGDVYRQMYRIRAVEERIAKEYPRGLMRCPTHFSVGQEAGDVAVGMALQAGDKAFSSHRSHGPYLAHGESITKLVAELHGDTAGTTHGRGGSMYLAGGRGQFVASLAVVGAAMGVAAGVALGVKMGKAPRVVACHVGDGVAEAGQFWEAINFASTRVLPLLTVVHHNRYATQTPVWDRQRDDDIAARVRPFMPSYRVGETDIKELHRVVGEAADKVRSGGPVFVQIDTYRFLEHVGPNEDDSLGYRSRAEVAGAKAIDPLMLLRRDVPPVLAQQIEDETDEVVGQVFAPYGG
tara:strand:+ start:233 stop:1126 length:894 start_codon:yes stop_codon:yes gene_type:complete